MSKRKPNLDKITPHRLRARVRETGLLEHRAKDAQRVHALNLGGCFGLAFLGQLADATSQRDLEHLGQRLHPGTRATLGLARPPSDTTIARRLTGVFDPSMRDELEAIERDMLGFQRHILQDFKEEFGEAVRHTEGVGTEHLFRDLKDKIKRLRELKDEYKRCMSVRSMGCYLASLYPGSSERARVGRDAILRDLAAFSELMPEAYAKVKEQIESMNAFFNLQSTLDDRKAVLRGLLEVSSLTRIPDDGMEREFARLARPERRGRYVLEYDGDELVAVLEIEA